VLPSSGLRGERTGLSSLQQRCGHSLDTVCALTDIIPFACGPLTAIIPHPAALSAAALYPVWPKLTARLLCCRDATISIKGPIACQALLNAA
jgi:hypothetical protein